MPTHTHQIGTNVKIWQHQELSRLWNNASSHTLLEGAQIPTAILEKSLASSGQVQVCTPYYPAFLFLCASPGKTSMCVLGDGINVDGSSPVSIKRRMDWWFVVYSYNTVHYSSKKWTRQLGECHKQNMQHMQQTHTPYRKMLANAISLNFKVMQS